MSTTPRFKPETVTFQMGASAPVKLTLTHGRKGYFIRQSDISTNGQVGPAYPNLADARTAFKSRFVYLARLAAQAGTPMEAQRVKTGRKIPCPGEAHGNAFIDHCMVCLGGTWGEVDELAPVDLDFAREARLDVPCPDLTREQFEVMRKLEEAGEVEMVSLRSRNAFYSGYRWTGKVSG